MLTLFHHPLCPHSRFVRLALSEYGLPVRLFGERVWERREEFLPLNPAGTIPVLIVDENTSAPGPAVIAEYLDEIYGGDLGEYLRDIPWPQDGTAQRWYARIQSRPSFQSMITEARRGFVRQRN